jgi:hypothetical protein
MASQVSLPITIDIELSDEEAAWRWTLPDARVDGFAAPRDIAWQSDINRDKPCCRQFSNVPQTARSADKKLPKSALNSLFEPQTFRDKDAV